MTNQQLQIPATYMRGGTSKGVFLTVDDLPDFAQSAGQARDALLMRIIGSPDPYGKHTDGMGGATSSTSKCVLVSSSERDGHDVDYLFAQIAIDKAFVDWTGNCGNLSSAVGPFAISRGLVDASRVPTDGIAEVRIWQANINKTIIAKVPMSGGLVQELGDFELDGVTLPAAEIELAFLDPGAADSDLFPTGNLVDKLNVAGVGEFQATMISAGIPTVFLNASELAYKGTELQDDINSDQIALQKFETIRAHAALAMGLIENVSEAAQRQHTPKIAFVAPAKTYLASSGKQVSADDIDLNVRALSMGLLHHAMMGTGAVAISIAAAIPGTLVNAAAGGGKRHTIRFGHPSGTLKVGALVELKEGEWRAKQSSMSRSARTLMSGHIHTPSSININDKK